MAPPLAALFWDLDGTLAETEFDGHLPAFNQAFAERGEPYRWDPETYLRLLKVSGGRDRLRTWLRDQEGEAPAEQRLDGLVQAKQRHYTALVRAGSLPLRSGVERLITEAAEAGLTQAIVTASSRAAVEALAAGALASVSAAFRTWICGEDVIAKKPDPEGYRLALSRLALDPARVLVLEDSAGGLAAAHAAGLTCVVTLSRLSRHEPASAFRHARAVVNGLGSGEGPAPVAMPSKARGPAGPITLSWLQQLIEAP
ncbi:HAD-IA family hydrolase [Cyanobium sp. FGCU-6]|nr:HAD-IA family hydrolase [Cyanobium sp. FGCU6]